MAGHHTRSRLVAPSVHGLEHGREQARRRSARRRAKNTIVSGVMYTIVLSAVGSAGYFLWQYYDIQSDTPGNSPAEYRSTSDLIDELEKQPRWNGPGAPGLGVDDDQP